MGKSDSYKGKKLAMEIAFEWAQMLDSAEKFKTVNLSIFKELKETIFKELKILWKRLIEWRIWIKINVMQKMKIMELKSTKSEKNFYKRSIIVDSIWQKKELVNLKIDWLRLCHLNYTECRQMNRASDKCETPESASTFT